MTPTIPRMRHEVVVSDPALCPAQLSSGILTRGDRRHCSSSVHTHCWIPRSVSLNCVDPLVGRSQPCRPDQIALLQAFNPPPACFAVSLLPSLASPQAFATRATFGETSSFEVRSAQLGPRHLAPHQHLSWGPGHHLRGSLHSDLNVKCIVTAIWGPRNGSFSKYLVLVPSLRLRDSSVR